MFMEYKKSRVYINLVLRVKVFLDNFGEEK